MGTIKDPSSQDLSDAWSKLTGDAIDQDALTSLASAIRQWPTGRLATGAGRRGPAVIVSWQWVSGSVYVTMR